MQTPYQRWYEKHKDEFNRKRRERYQNDANYRERMVTLVRASRQKTVRQKDESVFTLGRLAGFVGKSTQTLREWEDLGLFPKSVDSNGYRMYTEKQASMIKELSDVMTEVRYNRHLQYKVGEMRARIWESWNAH